MGGEFQAKASKSVLRRQLIGLVLDMIGVWMAQRILARRRGSCDVGRKAKEDRFFKGG